MTFERFKLRDRFNRLWEELVERMVKADWITTKESTMSCVQSEFVNQLRTEFPFLNELCDIDGNYNHHKNENWKGKPLTKVIGEERAVNHARQDDRATLTSENTEVQGARMKINWFNSGSIICYAWLFMMISLVIKLKKGILDLDMYNLLFFAVIIIFISFIIKYSFEKEKNSEASK